MKRIALFLALLAPTVGLAHAPLLVENPDVEGISDAYDPDGLHCGDVDLGDALPFMDSQEGAPEVPTCGLEPAGPGEGLHTDEIITLAAR